MKSEKLKSFLKRYLVVLLVMSLFIRKSPQGRWCHGNMVCELLQF